MARRPMTVFLASPLASPLASMLVLPLAACEERPRAYSTRADEGRAIFRDDFERASLGDAWRPTGEGVTLDAGRLTLAQVRNHPVWLDLPLPDDVRIEFDAWARSDEGDIKVELFGDGASFATEPNYVASGYVVIFGGWNNRLSIIARKDEHGRERETRADLRVAADRRYHFVITRTGGEIYWEVDGTEVVTFDDPAPLRGPGNDRFAFSGWEAPTQFDNLVIEAL